MDNQNPFANIGTPQFNISQIPQHILQNLNPVQLQMIQQRHQQLLSQRQAQNHNPGTNKSDLNATPMNQSSLPPKSRVMGINHSQPAEIQQPPHMGQSSTQAHPLINQGFQSINLPPQISQLPPHLQQQWLNNLRQQAIAKNNQAALKIIAQLQQQLQEKSINNQEKISIRNTNSITSSNHGNNNAMKSSLDPAQSSHHVSTETKSSSLPDFQTIYKDPPEILSKTLCYWSDKLKSENKKPDTNLLLYEQIIQRDRLNSQELIKERTGFEPISKFGFSNKEYITRLLHDLNYYKDLKNTRMESITNTNKGCTSKSIWGNGYSGYGNGISNTVTNISLGESATENYLPLNEVYDYAMQDIKDDWVPIRLEFDAERDKFSLRDTFIWNRNEKLISLDEFVVQMLKDYRFSNIHDFKDTIMNTLKEQIGEFQPNPFRYDQDSGLRIGGDDMRIKIKLDIVVGQNQLIDTFEWDISNQDNDPEEFSQMMCEELSLPGEFTTVIAHSIREQVHMYHKCLSLVGYKFDGSFIDDDDIRSRLLPIITIDDVFRSPSDSKIFTPNLLEISSAELERLDKDKDRDTRRKRRQGRSNRRGNSFIDASLPDLGDIPKTFRIPIPSTILPGAIDLGPSVKSFNLHTTTKFRPRLPTLKLLEHSCRIISHDRGKNLLIGIKIKNTHSQGRINQTLIEDSKNFIPS